MSPLNRVLKSCAPQQVPSPSSPSSLGLWGVEVGGWIRAPLDSLAGQAASLLQPPEGFCLYLVPRILVFGLSSALWVCGVRQPGLSKPGPLPCLRLVMVMVIVVGVSRTCHTGHRPIRSWLVLPCGGGNNDIPVVCVPPGEGRSRSDKVSVSAKPCLCPGWLLTGAHFSWALGSRLTLFS